MRVDVPPVPEPNDSMGMAAAVDGATMIHKIRQFNRDLLQEAFQLSKKRGSLSPHTESISLGPNHFRPSQGRSREGPARNCSVSRLAQCDESSAVRSQESMSQASSTFSERMLATPLSSSNSLQVSVPTTTSFPLPDN